VKLYVRLILCWLTLDAEGACSIDTRGNNSPSHTIALRKNHSDGFFYYRSDHYAIIVEAATLIPRLKEQADRGEALSDQRLLNDVRRSAPQNQYKDLFAFVLKDPMYLARIELLLADLLQNGEVSVVDAYELPGDSGRFLSAAVLIRIEEHGYEGREFCTPSGDLLLKITDQID
jgi:hypothetical protein